MGTITIDCANDDDRESIAHVHRSAFAAHGEHIATIWRDVCQEGLVQTSLVARDDDEVVGHVGVSHCWLDARRSLVDAAMLTPLATLPATQGRGIGTQLIDAAIGLVDELRLPVIFLEGSPDFYGRRGFTPGNDLGFESPSRRIPGPAFQVRTLTAHEDWMRGRFIVHDLWWHHDAMGLRDPELASLEAMFDGR